MTSNVNWFAEDAILSFGEASQDFVEDIAFRVEEHTKIRIERNKQVDTGFMLNSVYVILPKSDTYNKTKPTGSYKSRKTGRMVKQARAPKVGVKPKRGALVVVGANYAVFNELRKPFLFPALEDVAGEVAESEIQKVARKRRLTR